MGSTYKQTRIIVWVLLRASKAAKSKVQRCWSPSKATAASLAYLANPFISRLGQTVIITRLMTQIPNTKTGKLQQELLLHKTRRS